MSKSKKTVVIICFVILLLIGAYAMVYTFLFTQFNDGSAYGVGPIIDSLYLEKTKALNGVSSVVFDFRGYDTIGESFILLCSVAASYIILRPSKKKEEEVEDHEI